MKYFCVILCVVVALAVVNGQGFPTKKCKAGEHSVLYCPRKAEPDCDNPTVHDFSDGRTLPCDIPDCFCDTPTVRDLSSGRCVALEQCPKAQKACE